MNQPIAEGEVLAGKYRIERVLGQGGMGVVLSALHIHLNQRVAIKLLLENATQEVIARFIREARAAVRLKSEHVARVLDVGELPNGAPFMVMEYLEGSDLSGIVRSRGALPVQDAVEFLLHACEAIGEAHGCGIVHRDLKPANLFLTKAADGTQTVKVLDFGISKAADGDPDAEGGMSLTKTTAVLGSPLYMAPEQMKSAKDADARSDIWSLGAILYELLTGRVPFNAMTFPELIMMANMDAPPAFSTVRDDVPPALEAAVLKCLEKKAENRFVNVAELAWAIVDYGPPGAQASAERITRTIEAAGISSGGVTTAVELRKSRALQASMAISQPAVAGTISAVTTSSDSAARPAGGGGGVSKWVVIGAGLAVLLAVGATVMIMRSKPAAPEITAAPAVTAPPAPRPAAPAAAPTPVPVVVSAAAPAEPSSSASAAAVVPAKLPPTRVAGPVKAPAPTPPPPAKPPAAKKNPLDIQIQ